MEQGVRLLLAVALLAATPLWLPAIRQLPRAVRGRQWRRLLAQLAVLGATAFVALQLVPYGWDTSNPPMTAEPPWDGPATRELAARACFACHSNETEWPWYARVAPASWLTRRDVDAGREELNFSEWDREDARDEARDAAREIERGSMPPLRYELAHPDARLTEDEARSLADGLRRSIGSR